MRVVLLVTDLQRGGTPLRMARLAGHLAAAGVEVHVGCLAGPGPVSGDLEQAGVPTFACDARHNRDLFVFKRLAQQLRRIQPDVIHATLFHANIAARLVGPCLGIPVLTSTATIEVERRWHLWVERCTAGRDAGHIVNSRALAEHVGRAFGRRAEHVHRVPPSIGPLPQCIDSAEARRRLELAPDEFVVLWVGRFDPVKRLDLIAECAERLNDAPARFLLAGDGPLRADFEHALRRSPAAERVTLLGWQQDLGPALSAADVFLFPSRTEGLPNAVLQAMACGLPVVGGDIPVLRELCGEPERLMLCAPGRADAFVEALRTLRADPQRRRLLAERAAEWARTLLDPKPLVQAHLALYQSVRGEPRGAV